MFHLITREKKLLVLALKKLGIFFKKVILSNTELSIQLAIPHFQVSYQKKIFLIEVQEKVLSTLAASSSLPSFGREILEII